MQAKKLLARGGEIFAAALIIGSLSGGAVSACSSQDGRQSGHRVYADVQSASWQRDGRYGSAALNDQLDTALREHARGGVAALHAVLVNSPDAPALVAAVDTNSLQVANLVEKYYPGTHDPFLAAWQAHIKYYNQYLTATVNRDEAGRQAARDALVQFTYDASGLLAGASPNLHREELQPLLAVHGDQVLAIIDHLAQNNTDVAMSLAQEAVRHMSMTAKVFAYNAS
jgi:hypothetical protein